METEHFKLEMENDSTLVCYSSPILATPKSIEAVYKTN